MSWPKLEAPRTPRSLAARLGWMGLIWAVSVAALGVVGMLIRWAIT
ncbi:MAG: DUF2474 family protein [Bacillota bacterium]